jgi:hypothetical protein
MSPDIAIDRVQSFSRWNGGRFDALDEEHEAIVDPVGWRRRQGEKREYWIKPKVWREEIFMRITQSVSTLSPPRFASPDHACQDHRPGVSATLITTALDRSSLPWLEISA